MATNKLKSQKTADNDTVALGYLRKGDLFHKAEIQMLIALAETLGIKMAYNEKDGEVTVERGEPVKESAQTQQQSFVQMQRSQTQSSSQPTIDYVKLANALKEHVAKALQNAVESSPVHIKALFDSSVHMENNQTAMTLAREEWTKWVKSIGKETLSHLTQGPGISNTPQGKVITFGEETVYKVFHVGYEHNFALRKGWFLYVQAKCDLLVPDRKDLFREGIVVGFKIPTLKHSSR